MEAQPDFRDLLALLNKHGVEYLVAGGYAVAFHGAPRFTGDIDIYVRPTPDNAKRLVATLGDFGFASAGFRPEDFSAPRKIAQLGVPPIRVDLLTSLTGVTWEQAYASRKEGTYGDVTAPFLGRDTLVANKRATGRQKDLADIEALGEM